MVALLSPIQARISVDRCLGTKPSARWEMPKVLREVSGLALSDDGRLWVHNDESGIVVAIDHRTGAVVGSYRLGPLLPRADFEGIAVAGDRLFMVTSDGVLYRMTLPARRAKEAVLPFEVIDTKLGAQCEIEGLSYDPTDRVLLLACKTPRAKALARQTVVFRWSVVKGGLASPDRLTIPWGELAKGRPGKAFHASSIERDPTTGNYLLISSADHGFGLIDRAGKVLATGPIGRHHRQPEGLAIAKDGTVFIGDEGHRGPGTISVYACR